MEDFPSNESYKVHSRYHWENGKAFNAKVQKKELLAAIQVKMVVYRL